MNVFEIVAVNRIRTIQSKSIDFYDFGRVASQRWILVPVVIVRSVFLQRETLKLLLSLAFAPGDVPAWRWGRRLACFQGARRLNQCDVVRRYDVLCSS